MTNLVLDAVQCLLMTKVASRACNAVRRTFWETLPDNIPDLEIYLPALTSAVRDERDTSVLDKLSSHPLPTTLSPETVGWRSGLVMA